MKNNILPTLLTYSSLLVLSNAFLVNPVYAEKTSQDIENLNNLVVTAGRREQNIADVQASIEVITAEDIKKFSGASATEVLRHAVGVNAQSSGANSTISVRGQVPNAGSAVLILFDGLPRTAKFGIANLNNFPVEDIERIEVIRGPMSALYGANASAGVINIITKKAGEGAALSVKTTVGSAISDDGNGRETTAFAASMNMKTGNVGHRFSVDLRDANAFQFDDTAVVDDLTGIEHYSLTYSGLADLNSIGRLRWTLEGHRQDDRADGQTTTGTEFERFEEEDRYFGSLVYDNDLGPGILKLETSYGYSDGSVNRSFPGPDETTQYDQYYFQGNYFLPFNDHSFVFGAGMQRDEIDVSTLSEEGKETNRFAYLQDDWSINDDIKIVAGLRADKFDSFGTQVVPRLSIGSQGDGFTWRAGYGEAFRAPSVLEQYSRFTRGRFLIQGSSDLDAEETETWEASIGWRGERGNIELIYHDSKIDNLIAATSTGAVSGGLFVVEYQNINEADISGIELVGELQITPNLTFNGSYEYLDAIDAETDARLQGRARNAYKVSLAWHRGPWQVVTRARHLNGIWGIDPVTRSDPFASRYTVADLQVNHQFTPALSAAIGIDNLFDQQTPVNWSSTGSIEDPAGRYGYLTFTYTMGQH